MNIEGDFRYVDAGAFDECLDFLEYLNYCEHDWEKAFVSWAGMSERLKDEKMSQNSWGPWNLVKVYLFNLHIIVLHNNMNLLFFPLYCHSYCCYCLTLNLLIFREKNEKK